jgi:hypothetical protein
MKMKNKTENEKQKINKKSGPLTQTRLEPMEGSQNRKKPEIYNSYWAGPLDRRGLRQLENHHYER